MNAVMSQYEVTSQCVARIVLEVFNACLAMNTGESDITLTHEPASLLGPRHVGMIRRRVLTMLKWVRPQDSYQFNGTGNVITCIGKGETTCS